MININKLVCYVRDIKNDIDNIKDKLLNDPDFINKIKEKLNEKPKNVAPVVENVTLPLQKRGFITIDSGMLKWSDVDGDPLTGWRFTQINGYYLYTDIDHTIRYESSTWLKPEDVLYLRTLNEDVDIRYTAELPYDIKTKNGDTELESINGAVLYIPVEDIGASSATPPVAFAVSLPQQPNRSVTEITSDMLDWVDADGDPLTFWRIDNDNVFEDVELKIPYDKSWIYGSKELYVKGDDNDNNTVKSLQYYVKTGVNGNYKESTDSVAISIPYDKFVGIRYTLRTDNQGYMAKPINLPQSIMSVNLTGMQSGDYIDLLDFTLSDYNTNSVDKTAPITFTSGSELGIYTNIYNTAEDKRRLLGRLVALDPATMQERPNTELLIYV
ncbi:MAG: hypothetical protein LBM02_10065 [Lachnospiraceae bacterium]|jgi:hypothetical protein|nr:hypothetical protein [Lachnospiraceae bacterium]